MAKRPRIGKRLTELLDEHLMTHRELAVALDTTEKQIWRWANNITSPRRATVREIAAYFEVAPKSLIDSEEDPVAA